MLALSLPSTDTTVAPGGDLAAACFDVGAALALLGQAVTGEAAHLGLWLDRLALRASAATLRLAGRREDEAAIRDAALLTRPGDDPGPAGRAFTLWRRLVVRTPRLTDAADLQQVFGLSSAAGIPDPALVSPDRPAPLAAASAALTLHRHHPRQPVFALAVADLVLARSLDWPRTVPLLAAGRRTWRPPTGPSSAPPPMPAPRPRRARCSATSSSAPSGCGPWNSGSAPSRRGR